ncbi:retropepsin-like aspartic protease family protein [Alteromonas sp. CYL-A6]|uniref:retropepsin-like aspartic protease family protein n=1 Tax=Alteromonas nitratireducens TaxID=3390813 RepID=UPI0034C319E5
MSDTSSMGKWMVLLAWLSAIALLVMVFGNMLDAQVNPNRQPQSVSAGGRTEVTLEQNRAGHYVTSGFINNVPVVFLIDTGATDVSVPAHLAGPLGLTAGASSVVSTANGTIRVARTELDSVRIGDIVVNEVRANINPGMRDDHVLLGMSVLRQLEFTQRGDSLILRTL